MFYEYVRDREEKSASKKAIFISFVTLMNRKLLLKVAYAQADFSHLYRRYSKTNWSSKESWDSLIQRIRNPGGEEDVKQESLWPTPDGSELGIFC